MMTMDCDCDYDDGIIDDYDDDDTDNDDHDDDTNEDFSYGHDDVVDE